jgi:hypothetical protein
VTTDRETRIGLNEALFRSLNERIESVAKRFLEPTPLSIVCECGDDDCVERITVDGAVYERVRADGARFFVVPGHELPDVEEVIERTPGYAVVKKLPGRSEQVAEATDPRS